LPVAQPLGTGWENEEALDVEWAHAIAPGADIVLVEANTGNSADMIEAAVPAGATLTSAVLAKYDCTVSLAPVAAVSMSFGMSEYTGELWLDSYFTTPRVTFLAGTGDSGAPSQYPAYSPNVVAVGGTSLYLNPDNSYSSETAWNYDVTFGRGAGGGGGQSTIEREPAYQYCVQQSGWRDVHDVSFDADPMTGVWMYDTYGLGGWADMGGTSLSSPCWAGLIAIEEQYRVSLGEPAMDGPSQMLPFLYNLPSAAFHDINSGSNNGYSAGPGYDMCTGIGSPIADQLVAGKPFTVTNV
jgi:subtilase family serine protease